MKSSTTSKWSVFAFLLFFSAFSNAQWAVYDDEVKKQLIRINKIDAITGMTSGNAKPYNNFENQRSESGDITIGSGNSVAMLKGLDTKFETIADLTDEDKRKYVGTVEDCGQKVVSPKHWEACVGLRNLRLQTIKQSHAMLKNLDFRRKEIVSLIKGARELPTGPENGSSGQLVRYQFELQGQQALMQSDAFQLQVLMDGYKQREAVYMLQEAEARKSMLSRAGPATTSKAPKFFPLVRAAPSN